MTDEKFIPQLTREEARRCASNYPAAEDAPALEAGLRIAAGDYSRDNLQVIYKWKAKDRGRSRLKHNSDAEIKDALRLAVMAKEPRSAIAVLKGIYGVDTPVASAIATAIKPDSYTIIDFRALKSLGTSALSPSIPFYLKYLAFCINLAADWGMSLRDLDRALWQWSSDQSKRH